MRLFQSINKIIELVKSRPNLLGFTKVGKREDLMVIECSDESYSNVPRPVSGQLVMIANKTNGNVCAVSW